MEPAYNEHVQQIFESCCELLALVKNACFCESCEGGSVLAYASISECASRIQAAAEMRREKVALGKLECMMTLDLSQTKAVEVQVGLRP